MKDFIEIFLSSTVQFGGVCLLTYMSCLFRDQSKSISCHHPEKQKVLGAGTPYKDTCVEVQRLDSEAEFGTQGECKLYVKPCIET